MWLEICFSFIIIFSIIFIITIICLEINVYSQKINKKTEASIIASNIIENIKVRSYDEIEKYIEGLSYVGITKKIEDNIQYVTVNGNEFSENFFGTKIPEDYIVEFQTQMDEKGFNVQKKISINLRYYENNREENFEISTVLEIDNIDECNSPIISDEYFKEYSFSEEEYEIIPMKYSENKKCYITTTKDDFEWYNYSAKKWAKVLIFYRDGESLKDYFINEDGTINSYVNYSNMTLNLENYMYVWIPNFSIKDDITYFRYKAGKKAIKMDVNYTDGKYLYLNKIGEDIKDISEECSFEGVYGVWRKINDFNDPYYSNFNKTKYAPQKLN